MEREKTIFDYSSLEANTVGSKVYSSFERENESFDNKQNFLVIFEDIAWK